MNVSTMERTNHVEISSGHVKIDGEAVAVNCSGQDMLKEMYHMYIGNYPKFYKMDILCQLAFIATELLLECEGNERFVESSDRSIVLYGKNASLNTDRLYQSTINDRKAFFPSPSVFVYTLPNIAAGEIALRNHYHGETSYIAVEDKLQMECHLNNFISTSKGFTSVIGGWIDVMDKDNFDAEMWIIK